jgi:hypothetical protein
MKAGTLILAATAVALFSALAIRLIFERQARHDTSELNYRHATDSTSVALSSVQQPRIVPVTPEPASANSSNFTATNTLAANSGSSSNVAKPTKEPLRDPIARVALTLVGTDPDAEDYWFAAINDLTLPANERQDLIEDLNEEGLPDPEHPTPDDLPLIFNRLALIETIAPDAADDVNADAFREAYKDLLNLAQLAMGGGEPVR